MALVLKTSGGNPSQVRTLYSPHLLLTSGCPYRHSYLMRTTQRKGDIAVSQAIASFTKLGFDVAVPLTESAPYDLIVDLGDEIKRVQVRYSGLREVDLRRVHSNSKGYVVKKIKEKVYDWLYIYCADGEEFLIKECLLERRSIKPTPEFLLLNVLKAAT